MIAAGQGRTEGNRGVKQALWLPTVPHGHSSGHEPPKEMHHEPHMGTATGGGTATRGGNSNRRWEQGVAQLTTRGNHCPILGKNPLQM